MELVIERCCGVDVHKKKLIVACFRDGKKSEIRQFTAMSKDLSRLEYTGNYPCIPRAVLHREYV